MPTSSPVRLICSRSSRTHACMVWKPCGTHSGMEKSCRPCGGWSSFVGQVIDRPATNHGCCSILFACFIFCLIAPHGWQHCRAEHVVICPIKRK